MHPNPVFHTAQAKQNLDFARNRGFGVLSVNGPDGPLVSHVPFLINAEGSAAELHLVRSNPIVRALKTAQPAIIAVNGADSYVSPDWYGVDDQVPTWNYVAVHLRGQLEQHPASDLRDLLERQSAFYESRLEPKPPWQPSKMTEAALARMMRMIVPFHMRIESVDGTWKLGQNKTPEARRLAAAEMEAWGFGQDPRIIAALMRAVPGTEENPT